MPKKTQSKKNSNDKKYIIYGIEGINYYRHNVEDCFKKKDKIVEKCFFYKFTSTNFI